MRFCLKFDSSYHQNAIPMYCGKQFKFISFEASESSIQMSKTPQNYLKTRDEKIENVENPKVEFHLRSGREKI